MTSHAPNHSLMTEEKLRHALQAGGRLLPTYAVGHAKTFAELDPKYKQPVRHDLCIH